MDYKIRESSPQRLVIVSKNVLPIILGGISLVILTCISTLAYSSVSLSLYKNPGQIVPSGEVSASDPFISVDKCTLAGQTPLIRWLLPSYFACTRTATRFRDVSSVEVIKVKHSRSSSRSSRRRHWYTWKVRLHIAPQPRAPYPKWLDERGIRYATDMIDYYEFRAQSQAIDLKHQISSAIAVLKTSPEQPLILRHEENLTSLYHFIAMICIFATLAAYWFTDYQEELVFDSRHGQLFIHIRGAFHLHSRINVVALKDIGAFRIKERLDSKKRKRYGVEVVYVPTLEKSFRDLLRSRTDRTSEAQDPRSNSEQAAAAAPVADANEQEQKQENEAAATVVASESASAAESVGAVEHDEAAPESGPRRRRRGPSQRGEGDEEEPQRADQHDPAAADQQVDAQQAGQNAAQDAAQGPPAQNNAVVVNPDLAAELHLDSNDLTASPDVAVKALCLGLESANYVYACELLQTLEDWMNRYRIEDQQKQPSASASPSVVVDADGKEISTQNGRRCAICYDDSSPPDILFLPCKHLICCVRCYPRFSVCPLCQSKISSTMRIYT